MYYLFLHIHIANISFTAYAAFTVHDLTPIFTCGQVLRNRRQMRKIRGKSVLVHTIIKDEIWENCWCDSKSCCMIWVLMEKYIGDYLRPMREQDTGQQEVRGGYEFADQTDPAFLSERLILIPTLRRESFEGLKGVGDQTTVSWSRPTLLCHHPMPTRRRHRHAKNLCNGSWGPEESISCTLRNPSFWRALWSGQFWALRFGTTLQYGGHAWFSLRSALRRAIGLYPVLNALRVVGDSSYCKGWPHTRRFYGRF